MVAFLFARRSAKLQSLLHYEGQWFAFNKAMAENADLRRVFGELSEAAKPEEGARDRFLIFLMGQALTAYHLRRHGAMSAEWYASQVAMIVSYFGDAFAEVDARMERLGYPKTFIKDIRTARERLSLTSEPTHA